MATVNVHYIPDEKVREIREACSIVAVISDYLTLTKSGTNYKGLCPFHNEKTPSFFVNETKKFFHCFGCGVSGDVFTFIIKRENVSFVEAVKIIARRCGISLPDTLLTPHQKKELSEREELFRITAQAAAFYHHTLLNDDRAANARYYLEQRGISADTIKTFYLGYAPETWDTLTVFFRARGVSLDAVQRTGLIIRKGNDQYYDRFRRRIIFPVFNVAQHVIGFGGRIIGNGEPKYLNSPESPIYTKRESLYGLPNAVASIQQQDRAIVVEGYFDLLSLYQAGVTNAVAALGTALTEQQIRTLRRYSRNIVMVFDSDAAGQKAMARSLEPLMKHDVFSCLVVLPQGEDPDSFIRKYGGEAFQEKIESAFPLFDFVMEKTITQYDLSTPRGKVFACDAIKPLFRIISDPMERDLYLQKVAQRIGVTVQQLRRREKVGITAQKPEDQPATRSRRSTALDIDKDAEAIIIKLMLQYSDVVRTIKTSALLDDFANPCLKKIGTAILMAHQQQKQHTDISIILSMLPEPELQDTLSRLALQDDIVGLQPKKILRDCIRTIQLRKNKAERRRVTLLLRQAEAERNESIASMLQRQYAMLLEQEKKISQLQLDSVDG